jgi:hypothetical protein
LVSAPVVHAQPEEVPGDPREEPPPEEPLPTVLVPPLPLELAEPPEPPVPPALEELVVVLEELDVLLVLLEVPVVVLEELDVLPALLEALDVLPALLEALDVLLVPLEELDALLALLEELDEPLLAEELLELPATQAPPMHVPPGHVLPSGFAGFEQIPVPGSHAPASWHGSSGVQVTGLMPVQTPLWHVSVVVHRFPSSHVLPSALLGLEQRPVTSWHVPATWHWSSAVHAATWQHTPSTQKPVWHWEPRVHGLPAKIV